MDMESKTGSRSLKAEQDAEPHWTIEGSSLQCLMAENVGESALACLGTVLNEARVRDSRFAVHGKVRYLT